MTSVGTRSWGKFWPALACALCGLLTFQFIGNSTRGYIGSSSLFYWWSYQWVNPGSETQHGLLILGISVWLLVRNLRQGDPKTRSVNDAVAAGAMAMVGGLLIHTVGFIAEQARVSIVGLLLFLWGLAAFSGGWRWARAAAFPTAFMLFAIPFNALDSAGFWLRMWVVASSARIAHVLGIGVVVNGTQLLSLDGRYDYDVAAACSGVRSLVALAALSLLIGYLVFRPRFMWLLMFAVCFPLIFLGNVARIVSIIVAAQIGGQVWGDRAHEVMGFGVFAIVLGGVYGLAEYVGQKRPGWTNVGPNPASLERVAGSATHTQGEQKGFWLGATAVAISSAMLAAVLVHVVHMPANGLTGVTLAPDRINPVDLPTFLGNEWIGRRSEVTDFERQVLPPDTGFSRKIYVLLSDPTKQAFLSIVLSGRDRTSIHRPELCLVGQGWTIQSSFTHRFIYPGGNVTFPATVLRIDRQIKTANGMATVPQLFAYYFVGGDVVVASHWERIARDAWNRLAHGRSDRWAYVVVQTGESDGEAGALERIQAILEATTPYFQTANRN